jgi:hypothetical protein
MAIATELSINQNATAMQMAQAIFGDGVTVVTASTPGVPPGTQDPSYNQDGRSSGIYTGGNTTSPGVTPGDTGVILSTGFVRNFTNSNGSTNTNVRPNTSSNTSGENNNSDFNAAAGTSTFDAAYLDVDFIPTASTLTMQFVFSSEEYPEFQNSVYQDFVGVWVNGVQVDLAVGDGSTDPGNLNSGTNQNLYNDNTGDQFNTEMDGFTVTMTLKMDVIPGEVNSIRIGIADVGDNRYDSTLLIAGDSIQTVLIANDDSSNLFPTGSKTLDVLANDDGGGTTLTITHINGQQVSVGSTVTLSTGQSVQLNGDGTLEVIGDGDIEDFNFTYTVAGGTNTDIAFVNVSSIPCFVAGTLILTPDGDLPVESLGAGDLVITLDDGPQPVRWIGQRSVEAVDQFAPVHIRAGTFGDHNDLLVSPQHRILIRDVLAELLFGEAEVLVAAKDLVNANSITRRTGGTVDYVHLLFDRHQVVYSEGLATESFLPGPQTTQSFERDIVKEICAIFPELDPATGDGYSAAARRTLRHFEAQVLLSQDKAA